MRFAVWAIDRPGTLAARERARPAHRARLREPAPHAVSVLLAGPLLGGEGGAMNGTMLVVEAPNASAVRAFIDADPYVEAGVYGRIEIQPWKCGLGPLTEP